MTMQISQELVFQFLGADDSFPIDFDDAWQWIGWPSKRNGKDVLENNFEEGSDFLLKGSKSPTGGRPSEWIVLTVDCFKSLAMMAGTDKGREVRRYFLNCEKELRQRLEAERSQQPKQLIGTYTRRVSLSFQMPEPPGCFSVFHRSSHLLIYVEVELGLPIDQFDLLDGSVGTRWARYRKNQPWAGERVPYVHKFPDHRGEQEAWAYPVSEFQYFDEWLRSTYIPAHLPVYLEKKYGAVVAA